MVTAAVPSSAHLMKEAGGVGVVRSHRDGRFVKYQLDLGTAARIGTDIRDALLR